MRHRLVLAGLVAFTLSCGGAGGGGDEEVQVPVVRQVEPPPVAALSLQTEAVIDPLAYLQPHVGECLQQLSSQQLPVLAQAPVIDGGFADWVGLAGNLADPSGDANDPYDLTDAKIAASGEDIVIAMTFKVPVGASLNLEFGGVSLVKNVVNRNLRRLLRLNEGLVQQFQNDRWQDVAADLATVATGTDGTEIWLSRRLLGDVLAWPLWWVKLLARDEHLDRIMDSTAAVYFPSVLAVDQPAFTVGHCVNWANRKGNVSVSEIRSVAGDQATASRIFGLVRIVLDRVQALLIRPLPINSLAVLVGSNDWSELSESIGIGAAYTGVGNAKGTCDPELSSLDRGMFIDSRRFSPDSLDILPEGNFFIEATSQLLDLALKESFQNAPVLLALAMRQALLDGLMMQQFGQSYVLDRFRLGVAPFLVGSDQALPVSLTAPPSATAARLAKAVGFGHLLSSELNATELQNAWAAAGTAEAASSVDAFKAALVASCGQDGPRCARLTSLLHGWLDESAYAAPFAPQVLDDDDQDGLPNFMEARIGTDPKRADTDGDGWTDRAEVVLGTDPLVASSHPHSIVPDGDFSDWQELLPKRLAIVNTASGQCPRAAAIDFYAALTTPADLLIGAVASDFWPDEPMARWEITLDLPKENQQFLLTSTAGSHEVLIFKAAQDVPFKRIVRAAPVARRSFELAIDRGMLGIKTDLSAPGAVKLRLRTVFIADKKPILCSQSDWFVPFVSPAPP